MTARILWQMLTTEDPPVCKATDYCSPGSIWKLAACFLSWTLPEAIIATEGGGLIKSTGWLVYVALQLNLSKAIVRHLYSSCATSRCVFECIVMPWNAAVVLVLIAAVAVFLSQSWFESDPVAWFLLVEASFCFVLTESLFALKSFALCKSIKYS